MRTSVCTCGNTLFFDSTHCLRCGKTTGMCPSCRRMTPIEASAEEKYCARDGCGVALVKCTNFTENKVCNRMVRVADDNPLCDYCRLTTVIPDLTVDGNHQAWWRLERAKRRVLFELDVIGLEFRGGAPVLSFELKADGFEPVATGHVNGCITLNILEANSVQREKARVKFGEPQRTLVGHFRHELGHYFWDRLIKDGSDLEAYRQLFGDENEPSYADALAAYYEAGPAANWQKNFISAYATMHSWEDFAETFNAYLDMVSVLLTAKDFDMVRLEFTDLKAMVDNYQRIGLMANEFNRDMGLIDLVPEVFVAPVVDKLRFVHDVVHEAKAQRI